MTADQGGSRAYGSRCAAALSLRVGTTYSTPECVLVAGHGGWHAGQDNVGWRPWTVPDDARATIPSGDSGGAA